MLCQGASGPCADGHRDRPECARLTTYLGRTRRTRDCESHSTFLSDFYTKSQQESAQGQSNLWTQVRSVGYPAVARLGSFSYLSSPTDSGAAVSTRLPNVKCWPRVCQGKQ